jgi:predicted transcriptional regulator
MLLVSSNSSNYDYRILIQSQMEGATYPSVSSKKIRYSLTNLQNTTAIEIDKDTAFSSNDVMENNAQIVGLKRDFNLNKYSIKLNNSVKYTTKTMEDSNIINSNLTIGMLNASGSDKRQFSGQISEIIIFNKALSDKEYEDVESYLKNKYSIKF